MADRDISLNVELAAQPAGGPRDVPWWDDYAIHPEVAQLVEHVVGACRALNQRLGWVEDPAALDRAVRMHATHHLSWTRREHPESWVAEGLWQIAIQLQDELRRTSPSRGPCERSIIRREGGGRHTRSWRSATTSRRSATAS